MLINVLIRPINSPIKYASRISTVNIIFEIAEINKASIAKTTIANSKAFMSSNRNNKKLIRIFPAITTARHTANFQEISILSFRSMPYPTKKAMASTTA